MADQDKGVVQRAKDFFRSVNPFDVAADTLKQATDTKKKPTKTAEGLLKGRSSHILNENVKTLRKQGLSEADATKKAREFLMSQ